MLHVWRRLSGVAAAVVLGLEYMCTCLLPTTKKKHLEIEVVIFSTDSDESNPRSFYS